MGDKAVFDSLLINNNKIIKQTDEEISKQTKQTIISLAYTDSLTAIDLQETIDILDVILHYKSSTNKRKDSK